MLLNFKNVGFLGSLQQVIARFASLYESFQALTSVQVTHVMDDCAGSDYDKKRWVKTNLAGTTGTVQASDSVNGGTEIVSSTTANSRDQIAYGANPNEKRHYAHNGSKLIAVFKADTATANDQSGIGLIDVANVDWWNTVNGAEYSIAYPASTVAWRLRTSDGAGVTEGSSTVVPDTSMHVIEIQNNTSDVDLSIDGVLEVDGQTTDIPTTALMPCFMSGTGDTTARTNHLIFLEVYNTSVSISSSIYERLSALTQPLKQRFRYSFVGSSLNTDIWDEFNESGTGTFAMVNSPDEGYSVITDATSGKSGIDFNNKRPFDNTSARMIAVVKRISTSNARCFVGFRDNGTSIGITQTAWWQNHSGSTFYIMQTSNASTSTSTNSTVAEDEAWHKLEIRLGTNACDGYIDGVLEADYSGSNVPTVTLQPEFIARSDASSNAVECRIRVFEAWNKLTTETDYPSINSLFNNDTAIPKLHDWDFFDGATLDTFKWTFSNIQGSNTSAMGDGPDLGYQITTAGADSDSAVIHHNDKRQIAHNGSVFIAVAKKDIAGCALNVGLTSVRTAFHPTTECAIARNSNISSFIQLLTGDASTTSTSNSTVSVGTTYHSYKIQTNASDVDLWIDGVLEVDGKSNNTPTVKLQPFMGVQKRSGAGTVIANFGFVEYKNT